MEKLSMLSFEIKDIKDWLQLPYWAKNKGRDSSYRGVLINKDHSEVVLSVYDNSIYVTKQVMISNKPVKEWVNDFWEGFVEVNEETLKQAIKIAVDLTNTPITKKTLLKIKK